MQPLMQQPPPDSARTNPADRQYSYELHDVSRPSEQRRTRRDYRRIVRSVLVQTLLWLFGVPVSPDDARALVTTLITEGTAPAFAAAARISQALERGVRVVGLEPRQRDAVLATLESPPDGLAELRGALIRDRERRNASDR